MSLIKDLNWRYATKKMTGGNISEEQLNAVLNAINLSATSYGLQPFKVTVVSKADIKTKLQAAAYGQPQVGSSSHVLVFTVPLKINEENVENYLRLISQERDIPIGFLDDFKNTLLSTIVALPKDVQQVWATKQAYIALGTALIAAAEQKIDACPMEGFDAAQFDEILNLEEKGLKSVVMLVLGFRDETDTYANFKKVRKAKEDMFEMVK
ncbi:NAD(P)H-dependent oxidoreductase [Lacihabitans soyangensis]|uniref:NAD(P)H-dependent oxidoreductase n=1 Tax=Lacihabitans soyangensis TaxID=869394 RepID=A0AAE3KTP6_9BACT|nr:NAD(P)H-dependent oxidoreductase [Lacihabitans soyangensis]MCP9763989.1 NAD(P)H-dependent oxidoreductase [Lacihabitans soyangensis]